MSCNFFCLCNIHTIHYKDIIFFPTVLPNSPPSSRPQYGGVPCPQMVSTSPWWPCPGSECPLTPAGVRPGSECPVSPSGHGVHLITERRCSECPLTTSAQCRGLDLGCPQCSVGGHSHTSPGSGDNICLTIVAPNCGKEICFSVELLHSVLQGASKFEFSL